MGNLEAKKKEKLKGLESEQVASRKIRFTIGRFSVSICFSVLFLEKSFFSSFCPFG